LCAIRTLRSSVFWDVTQHVLLDSYRRFGTTYRYHLQGSSRTTVLRITILRCVKSHIASKASSFPDGKPTLQ